tara:strand:+ start:194 stop:469 length:276 start_codon:yes stop_codon:yes gene_type:complete
MFLFIDKLLTNYWQASQSGSSREQANGTGAALLKSKSMSNATGAAACTSGTTGAGAAAAGSAGVAAADETAFSVPRSSVDFSALVALNARK